MNVDWANQKRRLAANSCSSVVGAGHGEGDVDNCKTDKCRDKDPTVKAIGLRWELWVLQGKELPARCTRKHFSSSFEVLVLDERKMFLR
jgi:hypothetical protein